MTDDRSSRRQPFAFAFEVERTALVIIDMQRDFFERTSASIARSLSSSYGVSGSTRAFDASAAACLRCAGVAVSPSPAAGGRRRNRPGRRSPGASTPGSPRGSGARGRFRNLHRRPGRCRRDAR